MPPLRRRLSLHVDPAESWRQLPILRAYFDSAAGCCTSLCEVKHRFAAELDDPLPYTRATTAIQDLIHTAWVRPGSAVLILWPG